MKHITKIRQWPRETQSKAFYVYRIFDLTETVYIGKGSGRRFQAQKRKFARDGEIMAYFDKEFQAFAYEIEMIAKFKPSQNKHKGGIGGNLGHKSKTKEERDIEIMGTRKYAAIMLLRFDLSPYLSAAQIDNIRQIAASEYA